MRCDEMQEWLEGGRSEDLPREAREHLDHCPACQARMRDSRWLAAGFHTLAAEAIPDPSWGFAGRLLRRWDDAQALDHSLASFFEQAGRRFILGTLVLTFLLLVALILPPSGPVRGASTAELLAAQPETLIERPDPILGEALQGNQDALPNAAGASEVQRQK